GAGGQNSGLRHSGARLSNLPASGFRGGGPPSSLARLESLERPCPDFARGGGAGVGGTEIAGPSGETGPASDERAGARHRPGRAPASLARRYSPPSVARR